MSDAVQVTRLPVWPDSSSPRPWTASKRSPSAPTSPSGTRNETEAENGASHFLEHMAFKGTERRTSAADRRGDRERRRPHQRLHRPRADRLLRQAAQGRPRPRRRHHRRHPDPQHLRPRRARARARRDPAGDRPGQRHAGRHHLRPLPGNRLPRPVDGPPGARHRGRHPRHGAQGSSPATCIAHYAGRQRRRRRLPAPCSHDTVVELARKHFADLPSEMPSRFVTRSPMHRRRVPRAPRTRPGAHRPRLPRRAPTPTPTTTRRCC